MEEYIGLTDLPRSLKSFSGGRTITYAAAYKKVLNGDIPATRASNGRWMISSSDLPSIAAILGLAEAS